MTDIPTFLRDLATLVENGGQLPELDLTPAKKARKKVQPAQQKEVTPLIKAIVKKELYGKGTRKH